MFNAMKNNLFLVGITDNISILPTSLISPMEKTDFNGYGSIKSDTTSMMDIWTSELE